jgi:Uncharacterised protein family UPF0564
MPARVSGNDFATGYSEKKGRYGVTVPKPFAFDIREKVRPKTIRERKVEIMLEEKRLKEIENCNTAFRSKPIPPEVLKPRFEAINTANEKRRERVKQECLAITKEREQPFSFWEREKDKMMRKSESEAGLNIEC